MKIIVIRYNAGNVQSVVFALNRLGVAPVLTDDPAEIRSADKVIFPGVGEASTTMRFLRKKGLDVVIKNLRQPVLGVCLGMQLMCEFSEEGDTECLGIFPLRVRKFCPPAPEIKVPHMGWNRIQAVKSPLFDPGLEGEFVYFVHGFYVEKSAFTIATTDYILPFSAAIRKDNFFATQFHPEKSGRVGASVLANFLALPDPLPNTQIQAF
ncbi:MAG: imidazole glycerol phosphate synthase subunit HisH [Bacteroidetes bacterium]|nr:MAG: imidazole glycerol phosphate synthase subunit HisH [Bacteroidota bacterium]